MTDAHALRLTLTRLQRGIARAQSSKGTGGNNHRRIRIECEVPLIGPKAAARLLAVGAVGGVQPADGFGVGYLFADEHQSVSEEDPWARDPSQIERSWNSHARLQNALELHARQGSAATRSPQTPIEPDFDLGLILDSRLIVCEVKSTSVANEEKQLRLGLGQVLRYQDRLRRLYPETEILAVLAVESPPTDPAWCDLTLAVGVTLTWPPDWPGLSLA